MTRRAWGTGLLLALLYALVSVIAVAVVATRRDTELSTAVLAIPVAIAAAAGILVGLLAHWVSSKVAANEPDPEVPVTTGTLVASGAVFVHAVFALRPLGWTAGLAVAVVLTVTTHVAVGRRLRR